MTLSVQRMVLCFLLAITASFSLQLNAQPSDASPLQPVDWLIGGTWVSDVKSPEGKISHVENTIDWAPNHQAINFLTKFNGHPHYNGFYAYDAAIKKISFYYTSAEGDLTIGTTTPDPDGKTLRQEFDITHSDGRVSHVRSTIERDGGNAYWFTVFLQKNGEWSPEFKIRYERKQ